MQREIIEQGAREMGQELPPSAGAAFEIYRELLEKHNQIINLTALTDTSDIARLHFLDSLAMRNAAKFDGARVLDVGSGAGFPGVPLKIAEPSMSLTLLDATMKRVRFLEELCGALHLQASCLHGRAEELGHDAEHRETYDIAVSRAVARLNILCELCLPLVKIGGVMIAMKTEDCGDELTVAHRAIETLGAELEQCAAYTIPGTDVTRRAVVIRKISQTPDKYPRRFAKITREPL